MTCYQCRKAEMVSVVEDYDYEASGLPYPVMLRSIPVKRCPSCGEVLTTIPDPEGLHRFLAEKIIESDHPLLPGELRFLRKHMDKSAEEMGAILGVDAKTISRWENGKQKMGTTAERLLRVLVQARKSRIFAEHFFPRLHEEPAFLHLPVEVEMSQLRRERPPSKTEVLLAPPTSAP